MVDWRLHGQERFLLNANVTRRPYAPTLSWDHDHCEFCGGKFSLAPHDLHSGYCTTQGDHWICDRCYLDFRRQFRWTAQ